MKPAPLFFAAIATAALVATSSFAASCGNNSAGFEAWKAAFANEAQRAGVGAKGLQALAGAQYASRTIAADRNQAKIILDYSKII